jgi:GNAT superfamily N-acetyltransferase
MSIIKLLEERDHDITIQFLERDHELNLIMIFDIQNYGIENNGYVFQGNYYGAFKAGTLSGVACHYNIGSMLLYTPEEQLIPELVGHIARMENTPRYLIARADWAEIALRSLEEQGIRHARAEKQEYLVLTKKSFAPRFGSAARFAKPGDLATLIRLHRSFQMEYFGSLTEVEEELARMAETRMARSGIAVAECGGEIVAKAEILVRTPRMALIGGVYTKPPCRGQGLSFACMSLLCEKILESREKACLNVAGANVPAQHVYKGIGFRRICDYQMALFQ